MLPEDGLHEGFREWLVFFAGSVVCWTLDLLKYIHLEKAAFTSELHERPGTEAVPVKHALALELFAGDGKLVDREGRGTRRVVHDTLFEALALVAVFTDREGH